MFNPYTIVLSLFTLAGLVACLWGWRIIAKGRKTLCWPRIEGLIEESRPASDSHDLLPHIEFSYTLNGQSHRQTMQFPQDISPTQEFTKSYLEKFPRGVKVPVYYDPEEPTNTTLEPGPGNGDWLVFALGLGMTIAGILLLFFGV